MYHEERSMPICKICTTLGEDFTSKNPEPLRNRRRIELISGRNYPCHVIYRGIQSGKRKLQLELPNKRLKRSLLLAMERGPVQVNVQQQVRSRQLVIERGPGVIRKSDVNLE
uniref:(northern house mosquito) hypothetical protein n=1 Tax=Culex pipiens TaxID=7175 RepID=A0A8D8NBW3_CULPI